MSKYAQHLLLEIARCKVAKSCLNKSQSPMHDCSTLVSVQSNFPSFQVPEPWSGNLEIAPILFVSSNPSVGEDIYPTDTWEDECIVDFFSNRFSGSVPTCATSRIHRSPWSQKNSNGNITRNLYPGNVYKNVAYWSSIRRRAEELMSAAVVPGKDYAITEVVHCKSKREQGVKLALNYCVGKYLNKILCVSKSRVIIVVGAIAKQAIQATIGRNFIDGEYLEIDLCNHKRFVLAIPHPNARMKKKSISDCIGSENLGIIREALRTPVNH